MTYIRLKVGDAFRFVADGPIYVRCRGGYRHFNLPHGKRFSGPKSDVIVIKVVLYVAK